MRSTVSQALSFIERGLSVDLRFRGVSGAQRESSQGEQNVDPCRAARTGSSIAAQRFRQPLAGDISVILRQCQQALLHRKLGVEEIAWGERGYPGFNAA